MREYRIGTRAKGVLRLLRGKCRSVKAARVRRAHLTKETGSTSLHVYRVEITKVEEWEVR